MAATMFHHTVNSIALEKAGFEMDKSIKSDKSVVLRDMALLAPESCTRNLKTGSVRRSEHQRQGRGFCGLSIARRRRSHR
jgi:hypothetical protein